MTRSALPNLSLVGCFMRSKNMQESARKHPPAPLQVTLLAVGLNRQLESASLSSFRIIEAEVSEDVSQILTKEDVAVLLFGPHLTQRAALSILDRYTEDLPENSTSTIVLCAGSEAELFQKYINVGRIFYIARGELADRELSLLVTYGAARFRSKRESILDPWAARLDRDEELVDYCIRLPMQSDLPSAAGLLVDTARECLNGEQVQYLVYDAEEETLTRADALDNKEWSESAAASLAAFSVRTGERIRLDCVGLDPRYDSETDNPGGRQDVRFLAEPLIGSNGLPVGVVTVTRSGSSTAFSEEDALVLRLLAECAAPTFNQITLQNRVQALLLKHTKGTESISDVFREEALEYHIRSWDQQGEVLKTLPHWLRATYWVLLILVSVGLLGTIIGQLNVYTSGPAVTRANHTIFATAAAGGRVRSVVVSRGDAVRTGDMLLVLDKLQSGEPGRKSKMLTAPANGIVSDIRVRAGQLLSSGAQAISIVEPDAGYDVIAFLPESDASQLHPGMVMHLKISTESSFDCTVTISRVDPRIMNPSEALRYAGEEDSATFPISGRVIAVRAALPVVGTSESSPAYHDGVTGEAEVSISSEPVIVALIPGLRKIFGKLD